MDLILLIALLLRVPNGGVIIVPSSAEAGRLVLPASKPCTTAEFLPPLRKQSALTNGSAAVIAPALDRHFEATWTSPGGTFQSVPRPSVDDRPRLALLLFAGVALVVGAVFGATGPHHDSFQWAWTGIGIAGLFVVAGSLIQMRRVGRETD
jgi:hypothetical protein